LDINSFVETLCSKSPEKCKEVLVGEQRIIGKTKDGRNKSIYEFNLKAIAEKA
jgi:hypothetical protein